MELIGKFISYHNLDDVLFMEWFYSRVPSIHFHCSYMSGSNLLNSQGEPCHLNHGSDDCESGLVCVQDPIDITSGSCTADWEDVMWYVDSVSMQCLQSCEVGDGPNCGGYANSRNEKFTTHILCCQNGLNYFEKYNQCVPDLNSV